MRLSSALYRLALWLLPGALRREHGRAMHELFLKELDRARRRGRVLWAAALVAGTWDLVRRAAYERWRRRPRRKAGLVASTLGRAWSRRQSLADSLRQDVRYAFRSLVRAPGVTAVAVATLALGIGANSAIFSVVHGVVLRPLPFPEPERFVHLGWDWGAGPVGYVTAYQYDYWRQHAQSFESVASYRGFTARTGPDGDEDALHGLRVTQEFLSVLGLAPDMGRGFATEEHRPDGPRVAIISNGLWQTRFAGDAHALGDVLYLNERPHTIVGVLPPEFRFPQLPDYLDVLVPFRLRPDPRDEGANFPVIARLRANVTAAAVDSDLDRVFAAFREEQPTIVGDGARGMRLTSYGDIYVGGLQATLWMLMGATALVLTIACANVASLVLARASARRREIAVRAALGATRGRLARHVLTESVTTALLGGAVGLLLARWGVEVLLALSPGRLPRADGVGLDWTVLGFTFVVAVAAGVAFGLAAALPASRHTFAAIHLKEGTRGSASRGRGRQALVVLESALSMVLLVGAGLLIATLLQLRSVDAGFNPRGIVTASFALTPKGYGNAAAVWDLERRAIERLESVAGVEAVAGASNLPLERGMNIPVTIAGRPDAFEGAVEWRAVTPGYFETLEVPLLRGRAFGATDDTGGPPVAVVNESFARHYFGDADPIGQRLEIGRFRGAYVHPDFGVPAAEVVGVVADMRDMSLRREAHRTVVVPQAQAPNVLTPKPVLLVRSRRAADGANLLRTALREIDPLLPAAIVRPLEEVVAASLARERFNATLMTTFAGLALLLTAFGIYGVVSYGVRQRMREIGIRMALGAKRGDVSRLVVTQGMWPVVTGLAIGIAAAVGLTRLIASMIWGVSPTDPTTIVAVAGLLAGLALLASYIPARDAARADPLKWLYTE